MHWKNEEGQEGKGYWEQIDSGTETMKEKVETVWHDSLNYPAVFLDVCPPDEKQTTHTRTSREYNKLMHDKRFSSLSFAIKYSSIFYRMAIITSTQTST